MGGVDNMIFTHVYIYTLDSHAFLLVYPFIVIFFPYLGIHYSTLDLA